MQTIDFQTRTRLVFGPGVLSRLPEFVHGKSVLLVLDPALIDQAEYVRELLHPAKVTVFAEISPNPDTALIARGAEFAKSANPDFIVGFGGGSAMDTAKGINFVLTNGGAIGDYVGYGKAALPLLPSVGIPTTAGTGSEAQSYCVVSDADSHKKMACGDPKAAFQVALLDPELTLTLPGDVTAAAGYDAVSHAVESYVCTKANAVSRGFGREAFRVLDASLERVLAQPEDIEARGAMLLGAHLAGLSIENSMLGAAHACANPLTAWFGTTHGVAIGMLLHHVARWNSAQADYSTLYPSGLPERLKDLASAAGMPSKLELAGVSSGTLPMLADDAAEQWTGQFNPRKFDKRAALEIYQCAY